MDDFEEGKKLGSKGKILISEPTTWMLVSSHGLGNFFYIFYLLFYKLSTKLGANLNILDDKNCKRGEKIAEEEIKKLLSMNQHYV